MLLLPLPCCLFWMLLFSPWRGVCNLKIFVHSACFLGKEFLKYHKTFKADWLPSSVFLLFLEVSQICSWWNAHQLGTVSGCQMCEPVGSQGNVTYCNQSCGDSLFHKKQTSFGESQQHCSLQTSCQEMESDNADGLSVKAAFPYTQCCFHVVCESSDPESPQIPKEDRISCCWGCGIVVLASLVVFLLTVLAVLFSHISLLLLSLSLGQDLYHTAKSVPGACPLCGLCALTSLD